MVCLISMNKVKVINIHIIFLFISNFFLSLSNKVNRFYFILQLFYMIKGDMVLKVIERGEHRDIPINEGEVIM